MPVPQTVRDYGVLDWTDAGSFGDGTSLRSLRLLRLLNLEMRASAAASRCGWHTYVELYNTIRRHARPYPGKVKQAGLRGLTLTPVVDAPSRSALSIPPIHRRPAILPPLHARPSEAEPDRQGMTVP